MKTFTARCTTCDGSYRGEVPETRSKMTRAAQSNRQIWVQTHADNTGHYRFELEDIVTAITIVSRTDAVLLLKDDPLYSEMKIGGSDETKIEG